MGIDLSLFWRLYSWIHFPLIRRAAKRQARMKQSIPIAAHTPVTPRPNTWVAIQTIPMRKPPHADETYHKGEVYVTGTAADAAGHNGEAEENLCSSCDAECPMRPRSMTCGSFVNRWMMEPDRMAHRYAGCQNDSCTDQADIFCKTFS